jgi:hypothetical protein
MISKHCKVKIPHGFDEMKASPQATHWMDGLEEELLGLTTNHTWKEGELPRGKKAIPLKILCSLQWAEERIARSKVRIVCAAWGRKLGIDHSAEEIFSSIVMLKVIRFCIAMGIQDSRVRVDHFDIKCAFVAARAVKEIWVRLCKGIPYEKYQTARLLKSLYGLPEAMHLFSKLLAGVLIGMGMKRSDSDQSLYVFYEGADYVWIPVWVDDLIVFYTHVRLRDMVFNALRDAGLLIKNLGQLRKALGIEFDFDYDKGIVRMTQIEQKRRLVEEAGFLRCRPVNTPMQPNLVLTRPTKPQDEDLARHFPFRSYVGKVNYMVTATSPNLALAVSVLAQHVHVWDETHKSAMNWLLRYLSSHLDEALIYRRVAKSKDRFCKLVTFTDSGFAGQKGDYKSQLCRIHFLYGNCVAWKSQKARQVLTSTKEAELVAAHHGTKELVFERRLALDLGKPEEGASLQWQDNSQVINCVTPSRDQQTHRGPISVVSGDTRLWNSTNDLLSHLQNSGRPRHQGSSG